MTDNLLFNVQNIIILPGSIIHFMGPLKLRAATAWRTQHEYAHYETVHLNISIQ